MKLFEDSSALQKKYGADCTVRIIMRITAIRAAETLKDFWPSKPPARCHELNMGVRKKTFQLSMDLRHPLRLIFIPDHNPVPVLSDGGLDWGSITAVKIIAIEDTHE